MKPGPGSQTGTALHWNATDEGIALGTLQERRSRLTPISPVREPVPSLLLKDSFERVQKDP